jgi:lipid A 3-O-deacylase
MLRKRTLPLIVLMLLPAFAFGQTISNANSFKNITSDGYLRVCYENDFFTAVDEYYTQGVDIELVSPQFNRLITNVLLINPRFAYTRYGVGIQHNGYTPSSIGSDDILYGDRPFAGVALLKTFLTAVDTAYQQRFTATIYGGVIGEAALAGDMQEFIHRGLGNLMPRGWQNQIHNDFLINYSLDYEKQLAAFRQYFSLSASGNFNLGTLNCSGGVGATAMLGHFLSPFGNQEARKDDFQIYVYDRPEVNMVGYDATLQGGMFNRTSPYVIGESSLARPTFRNRFGFVMSWQGLYVEYFLANISKEFTTGKKHRFGGVQLTVAF